MDITVRDITTDPALEVCAVAGTGGLDRPIRWAHVTELPDPAPWMRGGELVLSAGMSVDAEGRAAYVRRIHDAGCVGLAFAIDVWMEEIPEEVLAEGDRLGLPILRVEGGTPFIAIVEAVADHHAKERAREQSRVLGAQDSMARAALRSGPSGVMGELASATAGDCLLLDPNGLARLAVPEGEPEWHALVRASVQGQRSRGMTVLADGEASVLLQSLGTTGRTLGWLAVRHTEPASPHARMLANHAASLLAVDLMYSRNARRALFRERAPHLRAALEGGDGRVLPPLPEPPWEVVHYPCPAPEAALIRASDALPDLLGPTEASERVGLCTLGDALVAVLPATGIPRTGQRLLEALEDLSEGPSAAGACGARSPAELPAAVDRARQAATDGYRHADDSDAWSLLRENLSAEGARAFGRAVLGPLREHDVRNSTDLAHTLRHFLDNSAHVEATARELGVHRNTLRGRLRIAERVLGGDLRQARTRLELWTALYLEPMRCYDGSWHR
ncbi:PucR family transcriptional regulator [Nocardiopsis kunsanensis]|uniref:PucR family transcriptional regulator n=1 Tax=Nocardiopsis kunsanensis TaxID=141693 RepID=UPI00034AE782|nr:PucR family transcriptional regulator [Nocardiopsis kunsanensis]